MSLRQTLVKDIMHDVEPSNCHPQNFDPDEMVARYGEWTLQRLHNALDDAEVICCAKEHEDNGMLYSLCPHFKTNLVCGHIISTTLHDRPLHTAAGVIATSSYVLDRHGIQASAHCIPALQSAATNLYKLDGASFVAYGKLRDNFPRINSVPPKYRQKELENIRDLATLRTEIMRQEQAFGPEMIALRNFVRDGLTEMFAREE